MMTIDVLLVDDQPLIRTGMQQILSLESDIEVKGEASDGVEALRWLANNTADVVLMDIRMRGMGGVEATAAIRDLDGPPVLVLTTFDDDETLWGAIDAGAVGFILKEAPAEDIVRATRLVASGGAWLDPAVTERVLNHSRSHSAIRLSENHPLSPRELEVLQLMATGASNPEIAAELHVGAATIKSHVSSIFSKLGVRDRAGAIVYAYHNGLDS